MRPTVGFSPPTTTSLPSPPSPTPSHSAWHSPVPYLFGGLAAMLGLIAFALLILACSYWKLSNYIEGGDENIAHANKDATDTQKTNQCCDQKIVVIMAGDEKPTFLATPTSSRASSFNDHPNEVEKGNELGS